MQLWFFKSKLGHRLNHENVHFRLFHPLISHWLNCIQFSSTMYLDNVYYTLHCMVIVSCLFSFNTWNDGDIAILTIWFHYSAKSYISDNKWILKKRDYWTKGNILGRFGQQMIFPFVQYSLIFNIHLHMIWHNMLQCTNW